MSRRLLRSTVALVCLMFVSSAQLPAQGPADDAKALDGLWSGSWGGGERDGVVFQPVIAEMVIRGDQFESVGFRVANKLAGTVRVDAAARRIRITPAGGAKAIEFAYELKGDTLTLRDVDKVPVMLERVGARDALAHARVEFVSASAINEVGDLLVTEITELRAGQTRATALQSHPRRLSTEKATILLFQGTGSKKISVAEARRQIRDSTPVVIAYRPVEQQSVSSTGGLWKDVGPVMPDSEAAGRTFARILRPGTLMFVLPASASVPQP